MRRRLTRTGLERNALNKVSIDGERKNIALLRILGRVIACLERLLEIGATSEELVSRLSKKL